MAIFIMMESDEALLEALETVNEYQKPFCNNFVEINDEIEHNSFKNNTVQKENNIQLFNDTIESAREINEIIFNNQGISYDPPYKLSLLKPPWSLNSSSQSEPCAFMTELFNTGCR